MSVSNGIELDLRNLEYVRGSALNKAIRISLNKAAVPVKSAVEGVVPTKTGFLKKALRIKTVFKKGVWAAVVGPSSSVKKKKPKPKTKKVKRPKAKKAKAATGPKPRRRRSKAARLLNKFIKTTKKKATRAKKAAKKKAKSLRKSVVRSKTFKAFAKKFKRKPKPSDFIRPARYGSILQFGSKKLRARHYLEKAFSRSKEAFSSLLTDKLREQLSQMMTQKTGH